MKITFFLFTYFFLFTRFCFGEQHPELHQAPLKYENIPYFTGSLITSSAHIVPIGQFNIEPYFFVSYTYDRYNNSRRLVSDDHKMVLNYQVPFWIGLTSFMDFTATPQVFTRMSNRKSSTQIGDLQSGIEFQLYNGNIHTRPPAIKLGIYETFPIGKYQNLDPDKDGVDIGGAGAYSTAFTLAFSKMFYVKDEHFTTVRTSFSYSFAPPVKVHGFHAYGGGYNTDGKVKVGNSFTWASGTEYSLTKNWILACDLVYIYFNKNTFSGTKGITSTGEVASSSNPSAYQWSIAPAIEYGWTSDVGIIAGIWTTFAGRNTPAFISGVIALNLYF